MIYLIIGYTKMIGVNKLKKRGKLMFGIFLIIISIVLTIYFVPWRLVIMRLTPLPDSVQTEIDNAVTKHGIDGVIVYIDEAGEISKFTAGYDNKDDKTEVDPDVLFKIASISKLYMAVAAAKLVDDGTLDLDDTLSEMLPQYKDEIEHADQITLRMLIQHRSGIPNYTDDPDFPWENLPTSVDDVLALVLGDSANFKPNSKYQYSNTNYLLLAKIMDDKLGYSHDQFIKDEILIPLDLHNTYYYFSETNPNDVMSGYFVGYEPDLKQNDHITPGGTMVASIEDVGTFLRALNDGSLLSNSEQEIYTEIYVYEHTGLLPGYQSIARYDDENDRVVIVFTNTSGGLSWGKIEAIYSRVVRIISK
jgi:CubicO group peptidase (beta-lactamase class C family)